jgi:hypothetical protein
MTVANVAMGHTGPGEQWYSALTLRQALKVGFSRDEYESASQYARMAVKEHRDLGTARSAWEPTSNLNDVIAAPYIGNGEQELARRLESEADPELDACHGLIENVRAGLDEVAQDAQPIAAEEAGVTYSVPEAVDRVHLHNDTIEWDKAAGKHHHRRASALLKRLAAWAPWVEAVGFATFITYYLNVPIVKPWTDLLGWTFGASVVVVIIIGQTWLVRHAAEDHNHARETHANEQWHPAEAASARRNKYLALTAATAVAITAGMIGRAVATLSDASFETLAVMVFVAIVTGLLLPTLAYLGVAMDGSKISRERDSLVAELDDDLARYQETISNGQRDLARAAMIGATLKDKTFLDICDTTQEAVDEVYEFYGKVRLLIGSLSADPPAKKSKTLTCDASNNIVDGCIGTSIPGARTVNLSPLCGRAHRLAEMELQVADLLGRIDALPSHPWGQPRTN